MARTIDHLNRVSESFDMLSADEQQGIVAELYTRLIGANAYQAMKVMQLWNRTQSRAAARGWNKIEKVMQDIPAPEPDMEIKSDPENAEALLALEDL